MEIPGILCLVEAKYVDEFGKVGYDCRYTLKKIEKWYSSLNPISECVHKYDTTNVLYCGDVDHTHIFELSSNICVHYVGSNRSV